MTLEQEQMWNILSNNYCCLAHEYARDIIQLKTTEARTRRINKWFSYVLDTFPKEEVVKTVHLWLTKYKMPMNPSKIKDFDRFHDSYGHFVVHNVELFYKNGSWYE